MRNIYLDDYVIDKFKPIIDMILDNEIYELLLAGGRGSTKSSFASMIIPYGMLEDFYTKGEKTHALVVRKVGNTLGRSVYKKIKWALRQLDIYEEWHCIKSPLEMTFRQSNQKIFFVGCDDPLKIKSICEEEGYIKYIWFEEFNQFDGMEEIRNILQSAIRGGRAIWIGTFNPSPILDDWANVEFNKEKNGRFISNSTYLDVPNHWLGDTFFKLADDLKLHNYKAYQNEYLGIITGIGGEIFKNVKDVEITNEMIMSFNKIRYGLDFGFTKDPTAFNALCYREDKKSIWTFDEIFKFGIGTSTLCQELKLKVNPFTIIKCDSQEPRTVNTMVQDYNINAVCCHKGQDSVRHGIEWLADLTAINIDRKRCPMAYHEFSSYSYEKDKNGNWIRQYPDKNNHTIDAHRYALDDIILKSGWRVPKC